MSNATKIRQKEQKETTKEGGLSSTIMDQKSIYNSRQRGVTEFHHKKWVYDKGLIPSPN